MRLDPYNRIMKAVKDGAGVQLDPEDVRALARDGAIEERASVIAEDRKLWLDQLRAGRPVPRYFGPEQEACRLSQAA